mmetsp:Transcript_22811/g.49333  ORF Transcript_22811/g.49333 Transcript_22811/m.49333 type:complete len:116 (-) Transcript_22811:323-670(-)
MRTHELKRGLPLFHWVLQRTAHLQREERSTRADVKRRRTMGKAREGGRKHCVTPSQGFALPKKDGNNSRFLFGISLFSTTADFSPPLANVAGRTRHHATSCKRTTRQERTMANKQ